MPHRLGLVLLALVCLAQEPAGDAILSPADQSVIASGPVRVIARGAGPLLLDGKPIAAERPAPGVLAASVTAPAGTHEISLGSQKVRFITGSGAAPKDWKPYQPHPPALAGCDACHAVKDGAWAMRRPSLIGICFACHDRGKFPPVHSHNVDVLVECQTCHNPHGSAAKGHLRMTKEVACKQCHG